MPLPLALFAVAAAVADLFILAGGVVASMASEPPKCSYQMSEESAEDIGAPSEHPGDADSEQDLDEMQASSSVIMNDESLLPCDPICPATTTPILDQQPSIPNAAMDGEPVVLRDQPTCTPSIHDEQLSVKSVPEVTRCFSQLATEEASWRISTRKRRASSIASSVESLTSHEPSCPREVRWSDMVIASSNIVASGSQFPSHVAKPSGPAHSYNEEPASKRHQKETTTRERVTKFVHTTRHKLSDLRPSNYSRRFRKQIRPALCRKDSNTSSSYHYY